MESFLKIFETEYFLMPTWKWFLLILLLLLFPFLRRMTSLLILKFKQSHLFSQIQNIYVVEVIKTPIEIPLSWIFTTLLFITLVDVSEFHKNISKYIILLSQLMIGFRWIQLLIMSVDVVALKWSQGLQDNLDSGSNQIIPFAVKTAKVVLIVFGVLITLQNLGINVVSLIAGLGIGGLAIALAGQETVANLFGSLTILVDKPFRLNDHVKVLDVEGTIVAIGFRSTQIKTFTNTIVSIPNSIVSKEKLENLSAREKRRIRHTINLAYETPLPSVKAFIDEVNVHLKKNNNLAPDESTNAALVLLNNYSIDVQVTFHVRGNTIESELFEQQAFLLFILDLAEKMKIEIAYPTQKTFVKGL